MISHLEIKGFKSLVDVSIDLGAVNVFIGANGSGKSNLLEAVGLLGAIASGRLDSEALRYRGVRPGVPSSFCSSLKGAIASPIELRADDGGTVYRAAVSQDIDLASRWDLIKEDIDFEGRKLIERKRDGVLVYNQKDGYFADLPYNSDARSDTRTSVNLSAIGMQTLPDGQFLMHPVQDKESATRASRLVIEALDRLASYAIYTPSTLQLRSHLDDIQRDPLGLGGSGLAKAIEEMVGSDEEKLGPFDLDDVLSMIEWADALETRSSEGPEAPVRLRIGDRFMQGGHKWVSTLESSEGALYTLFLLALVGHPRSPKMFAVDNFDQALHPRLACALTRSISDQILDDGSRQMFATTHNPLVLDGLDLLDDRIRLFTVDRDASGASQVQRVVVTEDLVARADKGFSLSRLWTSGRLGGVPKAL